jgi:hypothetical protein
MNAQRTTMIGRLAVALLVAAVLVVGGEIAYAQATSTKTHTDAQKSQQMGSMMVDEGQASAMMTQRQQMMANMKTMDQKLDELVARMNAARGAEKVDAVAAVVSELVAERTQMRGRMMAMQDRMMGHMMEHMMSMQGGMMGMMNRGQTATAPSIANCPLMKGLVQEGTSDRSAHHPKDQ